QLATTLGYIYLCLVAGVVVALSVGSITPLIDTIKIFDLIAFRTFNAIFQSFIISLIYSLIVLWFFGITSGQQFMRYWMFNWLSVCWLGIMVVMFVFIFGLYFNFFLTIFAAFLLAGATIQLSLELSSRFFRYGYGLPLYNILNGGRHLLFGSHSRFGINIAALIIYLFVFWVVVIITATYSMKKQEQKILEKRKQQKAPRKNESDGPQ
ncbi:unnamed protein product, partial [Rotaria socialis]